MKSRFIYFKCFFRCQFLIIFPNTGIRSKRKEHVAAAFRRIQMLVNAARRRHPHTHFISIPLTNEEIKGRFLNFKVLYT